MSARTNPPPLIVPDANPATVLQPRGYALLWRRMAAGLIDLVIMGMLTTLMYGLSCLFATLQHPSAYSYDIEDSAAPIFFAYGLPLALIGYPVLCFSRICGGGSVGYRALQLRLVAEKTGRPPGFWQTVAWWLAYPLTLAFGWLLYLSEDKRRMLNNMISGTVVVHVGRIPAPNPLGLGMAMVGGGVPQAQRVKCGACHAPLEPEQNFCRVCGTPTPFRRAMPAGSPAPR